MKTTLFSDHINRTLLAASAVATSSAPVLGAKKLELVGTIIGTLAYTLTLAKDQGLVKNDHPLLAERLTPKETAHKVALISIETMQSRLTTLQMALEEYQSGFQTTKATLEGLQAQYEKLESFANETLLLISATKDFFDIDSTIMKELDSCRAALNSSFPSSSAYHAVHATFDTAPACGLFPSISASAMQNLTPLSTSNATAAFVDQISSDLPTEAPTSDSVPSIPFSCYTGELKTGLAAYTCFRVFKRLNYFRETGWNRDRVMNLTFEAARAVADVSSAAGYSLPPLADLALTVGVYGTRFFIDKEKTELQRINEKTAELQGKTHKELFEDSKSYINSIAKLEVDLLRKIKKNQEQEGNTTSPDYVTLLNNISVLTKIAKFGNGTFNRKKSLGSITKKLDQLIETNKVLIASSKMAREETEGPHALGGEVKALQLIIDSVVAFKKELATASQPKH